MVVFSEIGLILVFKDYFSRHSDLHRHENQFLGDCMKTQVVLCQLEYDLCVDLETNL